MINHKIILRLCWLLLCKEGPDKTLLVLTEILPLLFEAEERHRAFNAGNTKWWIDRINRCLDLNWDMMISSHPELLNPALGEVERWK
jgi:hypothetical protein